MTATALQIHLDRMELNMSTMPLLDKNTKGAEMSGRKLSQKGEVNENSLAPGDPGYPT
jgi:hypothetical protein